MANNSRLKYVMQLWVFSWLLVSFPCGSSLLLSTSSPIHYTLSARGHRAAESLFWSVVHVHPVNGGKDDNAFHPLTGIMDSQNLGVQVMIEPFL